MNTPTPPATLPTGLAEIGIYAMERSPHAALMNPKKREKERATGRAKKQENRQ